MDTSRYTSVRPRRPRSCVTVYYARRPSAIVVIDRVRICLPNPGQKSEKSIVDDDNRSESRRVRINQSSRRKASPGAWTNIRVWSVRRLSSFEINVREHRKWVYLLTHVYYNNVQAIAFSIIIIYYHILIFPLMVKK